MEAPIGEDPVDAAAGFSIDFCSTMNSSSGRRPLPHPWSYCEIHPRIINGEIMSARRAAPGDIDSYIDHRGDDAAAHRRQWRDDLPFVRF
jgi:hypothetical protein